MKRFRILFSVALLAASVFGTRPLCRALMREETEKTVPRPAYTGSATLYHIVSARTFSGSVTRWLETQAAAYEKKHRGTFIRIEGMNEQTFWERIEYGRVPDGYSFFGGTLDRDRLQPVGLSPEGLREGLPQTEYAVPYCYTGYAALSSDQPKAPLPESDPIARKMAKEPVPDGAAFVDLRTAGDALASEQYGPSYAIAPIGNYTDAVCWLGIDRNTPADKAEALRGFFAFLCSLDRQRQLVSLGAFPVLSEAEDAPAFPALGPFYEAYRTVLTPDPFLLHAERAALTEDVAASDERADARFRERMQRILPENGLVTG